MERDTDHDWHLIGERSPYFGVLTEDRFRRTPLNEATLSAFFATGAADVAFVRQHLEAHFHPPQAFTAILDFGCGVGRLARSLQNHGPVVGVDISPGMLREARRNVPEAYFCEEVPDSRFDWINSYLVLQHIPPARGMTIIQRLLSVAAPDCCISLHVTTSVEPIDPMHATRGQPGLMSLYEYDLEKVKCIAMRHGFAPAITVEVCHRECTGTWLLAARGTYL